MKKLLYDTYYLEKDLFGKPYPELLEFFAGYLKRGTILDLGCGQGRNAIPLARMGFRVLAIDQSTVGVTQMSEVAKIENLELEGAIADIYEFNDYENYDFILLDSMFHFERKDLIKETVFIKNILLKMKEGGVLVICIQDIGKKVDTLFLAVGATYISRLIMDKNVKYVFEDTQSEHISETNYRIIVIKK